MVLLAPVHQPPTLRLQLVRDATGCMLMLSVVCLCGPIEPTVITGWCANVLGDVTSQLTLLSPCKRDRMCQDDGG